MWWACSEKVPVKCLSYFPRELRLFLAYQRVIALSRSARKAQRCSLYTYTVSHKKRDTLIFSITQTNIDRFSQFFAIFFTTINNKELQNKNLLKFSIHLKSVAALPCET